MKKRDLLDEQFLHELGVVDWGHTHISTPESFDHYNAWLDQKKHLPLHYLADHRKDKRKDLKEYFPEFETALVFLFSYLPEKKHLEEFYQSNESNGLKIASYAYAFGGKDYHLILRDKLLKIKKELTKIYPNLKSALCLDIHPVLERDLAYRAGLGWFGKNSMLIHRKEGSFILIASLLIDKKIDLKPIALETDHCGHCTDCVTACPTSAIDPQTRTLNASQCISTYTIEVFDQDKMKPPLDMEKSQGEIFGCDICQDVCPWNKKPLSLHKTFKETKEQVQLKHFFLMRPLNQIIQELKNMSNRSFSKMFSSTPLGRTGRKGLLKNLIFWQENLKDS